MSGIVEGIVERLLNGKEQKLQNSGVSKQRSHNLFVTLPHVVLQNIQFFSHHSVEVGLTLFEAFMMQREQEWRCEQASV